MKSSDYCKCVHKKKQNLTHGVLVMVQTGERNYSSYLNVNLYFNIKCFFVCFVAACAACGSSQARDQTHTTAVTRAAVVTMPDP